MLRATDFFDTSPSITDLFPHYDSTILGTIQQCPQKGLLTHGVGFQPNEPGAPAEFGKSIHAALAEHYRGNSLDAAIKALKSTWPEKYHADYRNPSSAEALFKLYLEYYATREDLTPLIHDGKPAVELKLHLDGNIPYVGTIDLIAWRQSSLGRELFVIDHKTTSQMGPKWANQWKPNFQLLGYVNLAQQWADSIGLDTRIAGVIVNGLKVTASIESKGLLPPNEPKSNVEMRREVVYFTDAERAEWHSQLRAQVDQVNYYHARDTWPMNTASCTIYGACSNREICSASPENRHRRIASMYHIRKWDPVEGPEK